MATEYHLIIVLLMALSCNLDNVGVGVAYGTRGVSIPFTSNLTIAVITTTGTYVSVILGHSIHVFNPDLARYFGSAILICTGIWVVMGEFIHRKAELPVQEIAQPAPGNELGFFKKVSTILDNPFVADSDMSRHIDMKEGVALALALSLNNVANGIGAGMIGLDILWFISFVFVFSIITIWVGIMVGDHYGRRIFGTLAGLAAGLVLVLIGIYELIS